MANNPYFIIKNYSRNGEMAISRHVFEELALTTIMKIPGVTPYAGDDKKNHSINLYHPATATIKKDGRVYLNIDVSISKKVNIKDTCMKIQEEVRNALLTALETVPVNININVASIEG